MRNTPLKAFANDDKKKKTETNEEMLEKRRRKFRISKKRGRTVPTTKENLQRHLDYLRGSKDLFV